MLGSMVVDDFMSCCLPSAIDLQQLTLLSWWKLQCAESSKCFCANDFSRGLWMDLLGVCEGLGGRNMYGSFWGLAAANLPYPWHTNYKAVVAGLLCPETACSLHKWHITIHQRGVCCAAEPPGLGRHYM